MDLREVVRKRRMVRDFSPEPIPPDILERVLRSALHAPSAGFAQGLELIVLDDPDGVAEFWRITDPHERVRRENGPSVVVIPLANKTAYLERYSEPDKKGLGKDVEEAWPVPFWDLDAAMAVMLMLLAATNEGLGAWYLGIGWGTDELLAWLGVPAGCRPIGAVGLGHPHPDERPIGSPQTRPRRAFEEVVHRGRW